MTRKLRASKIRDRSEMVRGSTACINKSFEQNNSVREEHSPASTFREIMRSSGLPEKFQPTDVVRKFQMMKFLCKIIIKK